MRKKIKFTHKIMTNSCKWIQGDYNIAREACEYYQNI